MTYSVPTDIDLESSSMASQSDTEERGLAVTMHVVTLAAQVLSAGLLHVFVPAVSLFLLSGKSAWLKTHVKEQLNFQITFLLFSVLTGVVGIFTFGIGLFVMLPVLLVLFIADIVCSIQAAMAASRGETYRFPFSIRLVS